MIDVLDLIWDKIVEELREQFKKNWDKGMKKVLKALMEVPDEVRFDLYRFYLSNARKHFEISWAEQREYMPKQDKEQLAVMQEGLKERYKKLKFEPIEKNDQNDVELEMEQQNPTSWRIHAFEQIGISDPFGEKVDEDSLPSLAPRLIIMPSKALMWKMMKSCLNCEYSADLFFY